jgi:hypothetical protein
LKERGFLEEGPSKGIEVISGKAEVLIGNGKLKGKPPFKWRGKSR